MTARPGDSTSIPTSPGQVVILNGVPRSGKSSIARAMQAAATDPWIHLGVDASIEWLPAALRPGVGLRPGGERPDLEPAVVSLYRALYGTIAAHATQGFDVVVDAGLHEAYAAPHAIVSECARQLAGLAVLFVGVHCPADVIWQRRAATWGQDPLTAEPSLREAVARWDRAVHALPYDLEVDTATMSPSECADTVLRRLEVGPPGRVFATLVSE